MTSRRDKVRDKIVDKMPDKSLREMIPDTNIKQFVSRGLGIREKAPDKTRDTHTNLDETGDPVIEQKQQPDLPQEQTKEKGQSQIENDIPSQTLNSESTMDKKVDNDFNNKKFKPQENILQDISNKENSDQKDISKSQAVNSESDLGISDSKENKSKKRGFLKKIKDKKKDKKDKDKENISTEEAKKSDKERKFEKVKIGASIISTTVSAASLAQRLLAPINEILRIFSSSCVNNVIYKAFLSLASLPIK